MTPPAGLEDFIGAFRSDERGASMALVALSLVWIVGMASLVIDIGDGWLTRQTLIPATDAAALAAAQDLVAEPNNNQLACATADTYVIGNADSATLIDCTVTPLANGGRVTVVATQDFDPAFTDEGQEIDIASISTATWGPPLTVTSLRPIAVCYDGFSNFQLLVDTPPSGPTPITIPYAKDDSADCGGPTALGNFATVDFESNSSPGQIESWTDDGYEGDIGFDDLSIVNCDGNAVCYERPYASGYIISELQDLVLSGRYVPFPVFNYADGNDVHLVGIIRARVDGFNLNPFGGTESWHLSLTIDPGLVSGTCCGPPDLLSDNKVVAICGVDADVYQACEPETGP